MKQKKMIRNEKGFTLVEIIAVLILLGILAAVAVPRYISLQDQARISAAQSAISELKGQAATAYGKLLLSESGSTPTIASIMGEMNTDLGTDFDVDMTASGTSIVITVNSVQGNDLSPAVTGAWTRP